MINTSIDTCTDRTLKAPGARLHYEVRGQSPLVVLCGVGQGGGPVGELAIELAGQPRWRDDGGRWWPKWSIVQRC